MVGLTVNTENDHELRRPVSVSQDKLPERSPPSPESTFNLPQNESLNSQNSDAQLDELRNILAQMFGLDPRDLIIEDGLVFGDPGRARRVEVSAPAPSSQPQQQRSSEAESASKVLSARKKEVEAAQEVMTTLGRLFSAGSAEPNAIESARAAVEPQKKTRNELDTPKHMENLLQPELEQKQVHDDEQHRQQQSGDESSKDLIKESESDEDLPQEYNADVYLQQYHNALNEYAQQTQNAQDAEEETRHVHT
jgi:hypothetical protein